MLNRPKNHWQGLSSANSTGHTTLNRATGAHLQFQPALDINMNPSLFLILTLCQSLNQSQSHSLRLSVSLYLSLSRCLYISEPELDSLFWLELFSVLSINTHSCPPSQDLLLALTTHHQHHLTSVANEIGCPSVTCHFWFDCTSCATVFALHSVCFSWPRTKTTLTLTCSQS